MADKVVIISSECLFVYQSKEARKEVKENEWKGVVTSFQYKREAGYFTEDFTRQFNEYLTESFAKGNFLKNRKIREEAISMLKELKVSGYNIVVTSDSSYSLRPNRLLSDLSEVIDKIVTFQDIKHKKSNESYIPSLVNFLNIQDTTNLYIISHQVHKELFNAFKNNLNHIWINQDPQDIVTLIQAKTNSALDLMSYPRSIMSITLLYNAITHYLPTALKISYMLPTSRKMHLLGLKKTFQSSPQLWYNSVWPYCPPAKIGDFNFFINKAVDLLNIGTESSLKAFEDWAFYLSGHPEIIAIDSLSKCRTWLTREQFVQSLSECVGEYSGVSFRVPSQSKVNPSDEPQTVRFPVLVKSNVATVTKMSHIMSVVFNQAGLKSALSIYNEECIVQEFINHDMTVYKIYVIGKCVTYKPRASCSNLNFNGKDLVTFHSAEPWPEELKSGTRVVRELNNEALEEMTAKISSHLGLTIFGYDILVHSETGEYIIVDVNVFPGFKEYPNINPYIESIIHEKLPKSS